MKRRQVVLIQGAFDILNCGHVRAFRYAKQQGDYLIVALNSDELIRDYKKREPVVPWRQKREIIEACRHVDQVVKATSFSPLALLRRHHVDVYVISREWLSTKAEEIAYMQAKGGRVCISRRFRGVSTTNIKARLLEEHLHAQGEDVRPVAGDTRGGGSAGRGHGSPSFVNGPSLMAVRPRQSW